MFLVPVNLKNHKFSVTYVYHNFFFKVMQSCSHNKTHICGPSYGVDDSLTDRAVRVENSIIYPQGDLNVLVPRALLKLPSWILQSCTLRLFGSFLRKCYLSPIFHGCLDPGWGTDSMVQTMSAPNLLLPLKFTHLIWKRKILLLCTFWSGDYRSALSTEQ